jgi:hypothetical protein
LSLITDMFPKKLVWPGSKMDPSLATMTVAQARVIDAALCVKGGLFFAAVLTLSKLQSTLERQGYDQLSWVAVVAMVVLACAGFIGMLTDLHRIEVVGKLIGAPHIVSEKHLFERVAFPLVCFLAMVQFLLAFPLGRFLLETQGETRMALGAILSIIRDMPWLGLTALLFSYGAYLRWKEATAAREMVVA